MFNILMFVFGLIWTENCNFGTTILISASVISFWYVMYFIWAFKHRNIKLEVQKEDESITNGPFTDKETYTEM